MKLFLEIISGYLNQILQPLGGFRIKKNLPFAAASGTPPFGGGGQIFLDKVK